METAALIEAIRPEASLLRDRFGVRTLSVFGSTARGEAGPDSDLDFLVEFEGGATVRKLIALRDHLQSRLGSRVDLVTPGALHPLIRSQIERESVRVA